MEGIIQSIDKLLKTDKHEPKQLSLFLKTIHETKVRNKVEETQLHEYLIPKIYALFDNNILQKDVFFLYLIANENFELLQKCIKHEKSVFKLDIVDPVSLYNNCIYKLEHWFNEIINGHDNYCTYFDDNISNKISTIKLIDITNAEQCNIDNVTILLGQIQRDKLEPFWREYLNLIERLISIYTFCRQSNENASPSDVFRFATTNCLLDTLSEFIDLSRAEWENISEKLADDAISTETFTSFVILAQVLNVITTTQSNINEIVNSIKIKLLNISNVALQLELLENIFALIFLKNNEDYYCNEKEIRLILYLLKAVLDAIKLRRNFKESKRFTVLNKYVTDANWRLDLIVNVKSIRKCESKIMQYLLSPPESLIEMCLKQGDFQRAYQVIRIFNLNKDSLCSEIEYTEKLQCFRDGLKKTYRIKAIHKEHPNISIAYVETSVKKAIEEFFKHNPIYMNESNERVLNELPEMTFLAHLKYENEIFMNMIDLALTEPTNYDDCEIMLQLAFEHNTLDNNIESELSCFGKKVLNFFKEFGNRINLSLSEILTSHKYNLDVNKQYKEDEFYANLSILYDEFQTNLNSSENGVLNNNHSAHKSIIKLNNLCNDFVEFNDNTKYLSKLFNYLKAFAKVLYIEQNSSAIVSNGKNTSYFELLHHNRSELMGKLLFQRNLDPGEFEKYFAKLKLDYLYHVIGNCFPTINLHTFENVTKDELYPENSLYIPSKSIITYIQKRNWLLAFILNEMYNIDGVSMDISEARVQTFTNYRNLSRIANLMVIFENNGVITSLQNEINYQKVLHHVNKEIFKYDNIQLTSSQASNNSNESLETGEEILEDALKSTNWKTLYDILGSIPERQMKTGEFNEIKDMVLLNLVQDAFEIDYYKYVQFIANPDLRRNTILGNFHKWPGEFCISLLKCEITRSHEKQLEEWLERIELCEQLKSVLDETAWYKIFNNCLNAQEEVISKLLTDDSIALLLKFIELFKPSAELLLHINEHYFVRIFLSDNYSEWMNQLLYVLPRHHSINISYKLLKHLRKRRDLQFVIDFLLANLTDESLSTIELSLKMLKVFGPSEQEQLLCLINDPLSIIEILLMNTKLDKLQTVLDVLKSEIEKRESDRIRVEVIDEMLRTYAEKSLDFRVITQPHPRLLRTPECKLMQSLDSLSFGVESRNFLIPEQVPKKVEWIQNNEVVECMCCQQVVFSMFNRRHHCRRCGRIICYNCSTKRMLVPTYGDILVRVCKQCYEQSHSDTSTEFNDTVSMKSMAYDYWLLTEEFDHNEIIREEFSYEHAPSVSLALAIMKFHSKSSDYPKFLLEQCDIMLKLLQPSQDPFQEIDYLLVIKMLKSLAIAAKMSSVECLLHYGTSRAEQILSQAELLGLLAERGCLSLLPISSHNHSPYIDSSVLRILRNKLLEREQWNLALEVSTKAGLDNAGVFAAWGKSCLKGGSLIMAREKFQRCLDKNAHYEMVNELEVEESADSGGLNKTRYLSKISNVSDAKPMKNPPLLNEIVHILESKTAAIDREVLKGVQIKNKLSASTMSLNQSYKLSMQPDGAVSILNKLKNLKNIAAGNYYDSNEVKKLYSYRPTIDSMFYEECIYYLTRYGTHLSLLEFYIKHGELEHALAYIAECRLSSDIFIDIYMRCLKDGIINHFQEVMSKADSTLDMWKVYLRHICRHLEKQNLLHSLYQLQQFMGDYIRAAMTCIRFYQEHVQNFTDLSAKINFLQTAEQHLKQVLEQEQWVEVASVGKNEAFEEKGITNPSLVMKIDNIDKHINTIWRQIEVTKFLADCESAGVKPMETLLKILPNDMKDADNQIVNMPTLFGSAMEKLHLCVLVIVSGKNIEDGFEVALKVIREFKLKPVKVYCEAGKQLANNEQYSDIAQLVSCIKRSGTNDAVVTDMCDEMLTLAVATFTKANVSGTKVEDLIKLISDRGTRISAYIEAKQLKTAYFLAVKYKKMSDIRRILREAELLNQPAIKALCQKVLQSHSHAPSHPKE